MMTVRSRAMMRTVIRARDRAPDCVNEYASHGSSARRVFTRVVAMWSIAFGVCAPRGASAQTTAQTAAAATAQTGAVTSQTAANSPPPLVADSSPAAREGEHLRVFLMTIDAGTSIDEKFGHDALWISDTVARRTLSYNYGIFDDTQPGFMRHFLMGLMKYSMNPYGPSLYQQDLARYEEQNRTVWVQELNLTPAQKVSLRNFLEWNNRPENMYYMYDYFRDNCTTRIRDALDRVMNGRIRAALEPKPSTVTYRWQARRMLSVSPPAYAGIELAMGHSVDQPLNEWQNSFLPAELMNHLRGVQVPGPSGRLEPLVISTDVAFQSTRLPTPIAPPDDHVLYTVIGILFGAIFIGLARLAVRRKSKSAYAGFVAVATLWSLVVGFFGLVAMLLWFVTDHTVTRANENILQANILSLVLAVLLVATLFGRARRLTSHTALCVAALSILGFLIQVLPGMNQFNGEIIGLLLPAHIGMALALRSVAVAPGLLSSGSRQV